MKLKLPLEIIKRLKRELRGRRREIGGVLVGEHLGAETFRLIDYSVQVRGGTVAHFERDPEHHKHFLADFFAPTGNDYQRFNYIGEWHSHPAFQPLPSGSDLHTMYEIVEDLNVGVNFAVLIIARLRSWAKLEISATLFRPGILPQPIEVEVEEGEAKAKESMLRRFIDFIRR